MASFRDLLAKAKSEIVEIDTQQAQTRIEAGNVLVLDVREPDE
jgi:rhodanese-related sulfurtransferase